MDTQPHQLPLILLVEQDDETRTPLVHNLRCWSYAVIVALDEADASHRVRDRGGQLDLILLNQFRISLSETLEMGRRIRQMSALPHRPPIVVMAERYGADMEGQNIQMGEHEYVTYLEDGEQLMHLLNRLCLNPEPPSV